MQISPTASFSERADALEHAAMLELETVPIRSTLYVSGDRDPMAPMEYSFRNPKYAGKRFLMGHDERLTRMPAKPTLVDFFRLRLGPTMHVLQSARKARLAGCDDTIVLACLLHDIAVTGFIRGDHGYWGAQLIEPYVSEEISWAVRAHQALRFFPDASVGYEYPDLYRKFFGDEYRPEPYIVAAYERICKHKWYMTARMITVNDEYSFDPNVTVSIDEFIELIERNFRQPEEGLGFDDSPSAHMWRTINWPTRFL